MRRITAFASLFLAVFAVVLMMGYPDVASAKDDALLPGTPSVQLSDEDGLEPFDSKKIAGLIVAGVMSEKAFFGLYAEQGVSEEQLVAVLKQVYAQQGFQVAEVVISEIVHGKLFPQSKPEGKKVRVLSRAAQASSCDTTSVEEKEPKKNVKNGPSYPYAVQKVSNTFCGTDSDWVLDYNLHSDFAKNKSRVRWWNKDWWFRSLFGSLTASLCQKPEKVCLGGNTMIVIPSGKMWDTGLWLEEKK